MAQLWTGRRATVDMLADVGAGQVAELYAVRGERARSTPSCGMRATGCAHASWLPGAEKPRRHTELRGRDAAARRAPQCCRIAAFRLDAGHSLGADVSAIRHFGVAALIACAFPAHAEEACKFAEIGTATVRAVSEAGIALEDGRTLRLAAIDARPDAGPPPEPRSRSSGLPRFPQTDRYGRLHAHAFVSENGTERWLQADLVSRGLALVSSRVGDPACAKALLAKEHSARAAKLGLWGEPVYVMGKAEDPAGVLQSRGRLALVEGKVVSVRESGGTIYVNFGRRWSEDFTVTIAKRNERVFSAAGLEPKSLGGKRVRIRGWIEERGGPWVEASRPEQIEVLAEQLSGRSCERGLARVGCVDGTPADRAGAARMAARGLRRLRPLRRDAGQPARAAEGLRGRSRRSASTIASSRPMAAPIRTPGSRG